MGMYSSGSAPSPDPRIGQAALMSAEIGGDYLAWMRAQADISNEWAAEDRARYKTTFEPLQDKFIKEASEYDSPARRAEQRRRAVADVQQEITIADEARGRDMARMGVDPRSGRAQALDRSSDIRAGLARAGAANTADRQVEATGRGLRADAVNLGSGFAVNPATSLGMAGNAGSAGFQGAMRGQQQMGQLLNTQYQQQMQQYGANQASRSSMMGGLGSLAGLGIAMISSKDAKKDKRPAHGMLEAVQKMPVENWTYKEGHGDEGRHTGPYAEDFKDATGKGDGETIPIVDAVGVTMGAVKELAEKVDAMSPSGGKRPGRGIKEVAA